MHTVNENCEIVLEIHELLFLLFFILLSNSKVLKRSPRASTCTYMSPDLIKGLY